MVKKGNIPWNKGKKHSKETKEKISQANKGKKRSEEVKKQMSISRKNPSKETRTKISQAGKGRKFSEEHKKKISQANKGKKRSEEVKKQMSITHKNPSKETREKIRNANLGKNLSKETKKKISLANRGELNSFYGKTHSKETKEYLRSINLGKKASAETKKLLSDINSTPERKALQRVVRSKQKFPAKDTVPEKLLQKLCNDAKIKFDTQHNIKLGFGIHPVDVFIEPNICLEADGDRIHANPNPHVTPSRTSKTEPGFKPNDVLYGKSKSRKTPLLAKDKWASDEKINTKLEELGYVVLRFWHSELETNPEKCIKEILKFIKT